MPVSRRLLGALAAAGLLLGCTPESEGEDVIKPDPQIGDTEASAVAELAERPADLSLSGVDVCALFSRADLDRLKVSSKPRPGSVEGAANCTLSQHSTEPMYDLLVSAVPDAGVEAWITGRKARPDAMTATPVTVAEFPAVLVHPPSPDGSVECEVAVGVAQGQALHVRFGTGYRSEIEQQQACELSQRAAAAAVGALREGEK